MSYTFEILTEIDESQLDLGIRDCFESAKYAVSHLPFSNDEEIVELWKTINRNIVARPNGVYVQFKQDGTGYGFFTALKEDDTFRFIGGFPAKINGSSAYALRETWCRAIINFVKDMGYTYLVFEVYPTGSMHVSYAPVFDQYNINYQLSEEYALSKGYMAYRIDVTLE